MTEKITIGIAEDHALVRQAFVRTLKRYKNIEISFEAKDGKDLFLQLLKQKVDLLLLDIKMPVFDCKEALRRIKQSYAGTKIIIVSAHDDEDTVLDYVRLGADSFIPKECDLKTLLEAINSVHRDGFYFDAKTLEFLTKKGASPLGNIKKLTDREISVLIGLCKDMTPAEIAKQLNIKEGTISSYKHRLFQKTRTETLGGLYEYALRHHFISSKK